MDRNVIKTIGGIIGIVLLAIVAGVVAFNFRSISGDIRQRAYDPSFYCSQQKISECGDQDRDCVADENGGRCSNMVTNPSYCSVQKLAECRDLGGCVADTNGGRCSQICRPDINHCGGGGTCASWQARKCNSAGTGWSSGCFDDSRCGTAPGGSMTPTPTTSSGGGTSTGGGGGGGGGSTSQCGNKICESGETCEDTNDGSRQCLAGDVGRMPTGPRVGACQFNSEPRCAQVPVVSCVNEDVELSWTDKTGTVRRAGAVNVPFNPTERFYAANCTANTTGWDLILATDPGFNNVVFSISNASGKDPGLVSSYIDAEIGTSHNTLYMTCRKAATTCGSIQLVRQSVATPTPVPMCTAVKAWIKASGGCLPTVNESDECVPGEWKEVPFNQLGTLIEVGETIRFTVAGANGTFTKARFSLNGETPFESTNKYGSDYYWDFVVTRGGNFSIVAELFK